LKYIEISGNQSLSGTIQAPGSKNSALSLVAAALLGSEPTTLWGIPPIRDLRAIESIYESVQVRSYHEGEAYIIDPTALEYAPLPIAETAMYRASYYFIGALLSKLKKVTLGYPGGDNFVERPIDQHLKGFRALGAEIDLYDDYYVVSADRLHGAEIHFDVISSGATMNLIMAAVLAEGTTVLRNAARDPEVVDTANMLNQMGARITGAGSDVIRIQGVDQLGGCTYRVIPDRLIAGTFLMAGVATQGTVKVENVIREHLGAPLAKLREIGVPMEERADSITVFGNVPIRATRVRTSMYPGYATDLQQPFTSVLLRAPGRSIISDAVFPYRYQHMAQLQRMGAEVRWRKGTAFLQGNQPLQGDWVHAGDVRSGSCLMIAALLAQGTTRITGLEHIERGYEEMVHSFQRLGAHVEIRNEPDLPHSSVQFK
jgi:UDP-N-acetylglucosamine 1-carboxyvinyltransferase